MTTTGRSRLVACCLDGWPALLALWLTAPLVLGPGHPLARDLVFVPHQPLTAASFGFGSAAPRAVPLDAVVGLVAGPIDGGVLARIVLPLSLAAAGWGVRRLVLRLVPSAGVPAQSLAAGFAVWNPYVVERLALGQWALLVAYACLPWLVLAASDWRQTGRARDLVRTGLWLLPASLTPTGGLLAVAVVVASSLERSRRALLAAVLGLLLQLPWVVPAVLGPATATSDPDGVAAFAARGEGPGGALVALLGLGGIWDGGSVPPTRDGWWGVITAVVVLAAVVVAVCTVRIRRLAVVAGIGIGLAALSRLPGGEELLRRVVASVPGAGLLRDSQKLLAAYAVLAAASLGVVAHRLAPRLAVRVAGPTGEATVSLAVLLVPLPLVLLPDAAAATWPTVRPVTYPAGFQRVVGILDDRGPGTAIVLPWRSYRRFAWGNGEVSSDPMVRMLDRDVVVSDDLQVGDVTIRGEDLEARRIGRALGTARVEDALRDTDVRWVVVYRDDPDAGALDTSGLHLVYGDDEIALYRVGE